MVKKTITAVRHGKEYTYTYDTEERAKMRFSKSVLRIGFYFPEQELWVWSSVASQLRKRIQAQFAKHGFNFQKIGDTWTGICAVKMRRGRGASARYGRRGYVEEDVDSGVAKFVVGPRSKPNDAL